MTLDELERYEAHVNHFGTSAPLPVEVVSELIKLAVVALKPVEKVGKVKAEPVLAAPVTE